VGLRKPDPAIYELTLTQMHIQPEQCVFVDDKERNTEVARALGMKVIVFRSAADLERKMAGMKSHRRNQLTAILESSST
jgi:putative hydrolase of the HAD superfamily